MAVVALLLGIGMGAMVGRSPSSSSGEGGRSPDSGTVSVAKPGKPGHSEASRHAGTSTLRIEVGVQGENLVIENLSDKTLTGVNIRINGEYALRGMVAKAYGQEIEPGERYYNLHQFQNSSGQKFSVQIYGVKTVEVKADQGSWKGPLTR